MMRVIVCGGREYGCIPRGVAKYTPAYHAAIKQASNEVQYFRDVMETLMVDRGISVIIHGAARGADELAHAWAKRKLIQTIIYKANWYPNGRAGGLDRSAGPRRNQQMLDEGKPDLVVAFRGGTGTNDMIERARKARVEVIEAQP